MPNARLAMVSLGATLITDMSLFYESDVTTRSLYRFDLRVRAPRPTLATLKTPGTMTVRLLKQTGREATKRHCTFELDSLPPGARAEGATLKFTVVSGADAIEDSRLSRLIRRTRYSLKGVRLLLADPLVWRRGVTVKD